MLFNYWGKTARDKSTVGDAYHLLCWHSMDVAACGYTIVINNHFYAADIFSRLGMDNREQAARFFSWLLLWHDIGKFSRLFQQQFTHDGLIGAARNVHISGHHHTVTGKWLWKNHLRERVAATVTSPLSANRTLRLLDSWMAISIGHHGMPVADCQCANDFLAEDIQAVLMYADEIARNFPVPVIPDSWGEKAWKERFQPLSWLVSGLVVLADWAGSNSDYFQMQASAQTFSGYWSDALQKATRALKTIPTQSDVSPFSDIQRLFPFITQPTPLQQQMREIDISAAGPQLFILEDVTGAGKTEAALILAHRLMSAGKAKGIYIGLPTMATANAMYDRMHQTWEKLYTEASRPSLILAHSARQLSDTFSRSLGTLPGDETNDSGDELPPFQGCAAWFADSRKKSLLAEVGVGTLDQALMAVLPFRHQNLRLLGLNHKILLADEIHAYDSYTGRLLESLIEAHTACGNTTILLSATLSQKQRESLAAAFHRGLKMTRPIPVLEKHDYPWVTHLSSDAATGLPVATREQVKRRVQVGWLEEESACIRTILQAVEEGKCIAWIRNSVDDAIRSYRQLCGEPACDSVMLFHSRFAFKDRLEIERNTLTWFGKHSGSERAGKVLIATQVVEQSMDLDFDLLISDLAPVDLLIQRAGRLQRHVRNRYGDMKTAGQDERQPPCLLILAPAWDDEPKPDWLSATLRNTSFVYEDHATLWLTQRILRAQGEIVMPEAARLLIESVYGDESAIPQGLIRARENAEGGDLSARTLARNSELSLSVGYGDDVLFSGWEDKQSTRLGEQTEDLWLVFRRHGEIMPYASGDNAWEMSYLRVRKSWWEKHAAEFTTLSGSALESWYSAQRKGSGSVIILPDDDSQSGYSAREGLTGR